MEDEALLLRLANDSRREIPRSAVDLIEKRFRKSDPVWTGAAIGAAAGGGFGAVIVSQGDIVYSVVPISMLIGAGIGTLIDAAHVGGGQAYEVIYRR
ncbi:MAG TPA: hypothetical protein VLU25_00295 [Acidobacteriota bacterium]|nr:hypothetical protein [Acidobacteriota bacterium]